MEKKQCNFYKLQCQDGLRVEARSIPYKICQLHMMENVAGINSYNIFCCNPGLVDSSAIEKG